MQRANIGAITRSRVATKSGASALKREAPAPDTCSPFSALIAMSWQLRPPCGEAEWAMQDTNL
jgi:hypothetical protein